MNKSEWRAIPLFTPIRILWNDAESESDDWQHADQLSAELTLVETLGWLLVVTDELVMTCGDLIRDSDGAHRYHTVARIPLGCVRSIHSLT